VPTTFRGGNSEAFPGESRGRLPIASLEPFAIARCRRVGLVTLFRLRPRTRLARGRDVVGTSALEEFFHSSDLVRRRAMDREQHAAVLDATLVPLGFVLGKSHADERTNQPAYRSADPNACERGHDRTGSDEWSQSGDGECADAGKQSQRAADRAARRRAGGRALGRLRVLLVGELLRALVVRQQHRNVVVGKAFTDQRVYGACRIVSAGIDSEYGNFLVFHGDTPGDREWVGYCLAPFAGAMVISLVTWSAPATSAAFAATARFSSSDRTGPLRVTRPSWAITFTLCA